MGANALFRCVQNARLGERERVRNALAGQLRRAPAQCPSRAAHGEAAEVSKEGEPKAEEGQRKVKRRRHDRETPWEESEKMAEAAPQKEPETRKER